MTQKAREMENFRLENESRKFYKNAKWISISFKPRLNTCRNNEGKIVEGETEIMKRWTEYFTNLLNKKNVDKETEECESKVQGPEQMNEEPTVEEVRTSIYQIKNNIAPGEDSIVAELIKNGRPCLETAIHNLIGQVWRQEGMPTEWKHGLLIRPIFKKRDKTVCENHRGITLLNVTYKIFMPRKYWVTTGMVSGKTGELRIKFLFWP